VEQKRQFRGEKGVFSQPDGLHIYEVAAFENGFFFST
jgi:hypothetical protein